MIKSLKKSKIIEVAIHIRNKNVVEVEEPSDLKTHFQVWDNFWQLKALKNDEKRSYFTLKAL